MFNEISRRVAARLLAPTGRLWHAPVANTDMARLASELRSAMARLPRKNGATDGWASFSDRLAAQLAERHPVSFLRCPVVRTTMFVAKAAYLREEFRHLRNSSLWVTHWRPALQESRVGNPDPLWLYPWSSGNTVHHLYHLCRFGEETGADPAKLRFVLEFGGGYGNLCRLFQRLGFRGHYAIYDLPHVAALQRYYLSAVGSNAATITLTSSQIEAVQALNEAATDSSMFVAMWSLSETPVVEREFVASRLKDFAYILIGYQGTFEGIDNVNYFSGLQRNLVTTHDCLTCPISHLPDSFYLLACRKATSPGGQG
jgi:hypothetical protein